MNTPYTEAELSEVTYYRIKGQVDGKWYLVDCPTQFFCNGLQTHFERLFQDGKGTPCDPPAEGEKAVFVS